MVASAPNQSVMFTPGEFNNEIQMTDSVSQIHLGRTPSVQVVVVNPTNVSIVVPKDMVLGSVEAISAVIPISPKPKNPTSEQENPSPTPPISPSLDEPEPPVPVPAESQFPAQEQPPDLDISHLSPEQQEYLSMCPIVQSHVICMMK
jgi:hypothetical protein